METSASSPRAAESERRSEAGSSPARGRRTGMAPASAQAAASWCPFDSKIWPGRGSPPGGRSRRRWRGCPRGDAGAPGAPAGRAPRPARWRPRPPPGRPEAPPPPARRRRRPCARSARASAARRKRAPLPERSHLLLHLDGVGARRQRRPGEDPRTGPRGKGAGLVVSGEHLEGDGEAGAGARRVGGPERVPVHLGVVEGRQRPVGADLLGERPPQRRREGHPLGGSGATSSIAWRIRARASGGVSTLRF